MRWLNVLLLTYGIINIVIAIQSFGSKAGLSVPVFAGLFGALSIAAVALAQTNPRPGRIASSVFGLILLLFYASKALDGDSLSVMLAFLSLVVDVCLVGAHFYAVNKRKTETENTEKS